MSDDNSPFDKSPWFCGEPIDVKSSSDHIYACHMELVWLGSTSSARRAVTEPYRNNLKLPKVFPEWHRVLEACCTGLPHGSL
jgi:hypothetical protein